MKTPEEMAMEYIKDVETARNPSVTAMAFPQMQRAFLAGYKAGCENTQTQLAVGEKTIRELLGKPQWISVKDRLPEPLESVLIIYAPTNAAKNDYRMECWNWPETDVYETKFITHWMPLPAPPKEEK